MGGPGEESATSDGACGAGDSDVAAFVLRPPVSFGSFSSSNACTMQIQEIL